MKKLSSNFKSRGVSRLSAGAWGLCAAALTGMASAQTPTTAASIDDLQEVTVVGSRIKGAVTTEALPVVVVDQELIQTTGAVSGDELFRNIPQLGEVLFEAQNNPQTSNAARGDVNSFNLRSLGVGNTLVLVNGRRMVTHPTSQGTTDTGTVPVLSYNSNAISVSGVDRIEVLLDGAAAIYGADAVAGVVNVVTKNRLDGVEIEAQYGGAENTSLRELDVNFAAGKNFDGGNIALFVDYTDRKALKAADQDFTATDDRRPLFVGTAFESSSTPDSRATRGAWPNMATPTANGIIRRGTTALTTSAGAFNIRPAAVGSCAYSFSTDLCLATGTVNYTTFRNLRYDTAYGVTVLPETQRTNVMLTGEYTFGNDITAFAEASYYAADTFRLQPPVILLNALWVPASNYWNPFGPTTLPNGQPNPNRIPGLTNVPAAGLPVNLTNYRFNDVGFQNVNVDNYQSRLVTGLRGARWGYDWEVGLLYGEAQATDTSDNVSASKLQRSLALSTPDAYNPFNGGCVSTPSYGDCTPSSQAAIDAVRIDLVRKTRSTLALADLKFSRSDLFALPGGNVGVAAGVEARRETQRDERDENLDGTIPFVDSVTGAITESNVVAVSPNPDTYGTRSVTAAYLEFAVPLVSPSMQIPLMRRINLQLAGRYEDYSDFGSVSKPKIAMAWDLAEGVRLRGSYSEGFRAPNLEQVNAKEYARLSTQTDYVRCEADLRAKRITSFTACSRSIATSLRVSGNPDLKPETSTNQSIGLVFEPAFVPDSLGRWVFSVDSWKIEQKDIVGLLGAQPSVVQDYFDRVSGSSYSKIIRAPVTAEDTTLFAGTGIAPAGVILQIKDQFVNLLPQTVEGLDFAIDWRLKGTPLGDFALSINAAKLETFSREPGPVVDALYAARAAGKINAGTPLPDPSNLIRVNSRPELKWSGSLRWRKGPVRVGLSTRYIGDVEETGFLDPAGARWLVDSQLTYNLYGEYEFKEGPFGKTSVRLGGRNITDKAPPLTSSGYLGSLYSPYGRYLYASVKTSF
ncbi:MAG: TonB-dependent receptor plug domain-containing protein [Steroidobacteraceae bacterium]